MTTLDPILTALARTEERLLEQMDVRFGDLRVDLRLDLDRAFDALCQRLDRILERPTSDPDRWLSDEPKRG